MRNFFNTALYDLSEDCSTYIMKRHIADQYHASIKVQLDNWLIGINEHTKNLPEGMEEECCPDFSCCRPKLAWPQELRQQFANADYAERQSMLIKGFSALCKEETGIEPLILSEVNIVNGVN